MSAICVLCVKPLERMHHLTGRDHRDVYLDPLLVWPLCHDCHEYLHDDWRQEHLDKLKAPRSNAGYVAVRQHRIAMNFGRLDQIQGGGTLWGALAEAHQRWAEDLDGHLRLLDEICPRWSRDGRFMR